MNIFYVDQSPIFAAQALVDMHVNKMVSETAQILSNCYTLDELKLATPTRAGTARKHSYPHHPCCKWVQESKFNWWWLIIHGRALERERLYRGFQPHYSAKFINWSTENPPTLPLVPFTDPPQAFGEYAYLRSKDPVSAYRRYYNIAKRAQESLQKVWTRREPPTWWTDYEKNQNCN